MNGRGFRVAAMTALHVAALGACGCRSVRGDEALAVLEVSTAAGLPPFTTARFSVAGRPEIAPHEVRYDGRSTLKLGYYLPGPGGTLRISGQALSASCLVGTGSAEVDVQLGRVSSPVALIIKPLAEPDPACVARDGSVDGDRDGIVDGDRDSVRDGDNDNDNDGRDATGIDAPTDLGDGPSADTTVDAPATANDAAAPIDGAATDAVLDRAPDVVPDVMSVVDAAVDLPAVVDATAEMMSNPPPPPPPACMAATKACPGSAECCSGLVCGTTTLGRVCCGNYNMTCNRAGGEDCCGQLECVSGHCCLPATYACSGGSCCAGLVCGTTTLGRVCCGNSGAPCKRADGADCCGALECVNGVCR